MKYKNFPFWHMEAQVDILDELRPAFWHYDNRERTNSSPSSRRERQRFFNFTKFVKSACINYKINADQVNNYLKSGVTFNVVKQNLLQLQNQKKLHFCKAFLRHSCMTKVILCMYWDVYSSYFVKQQVALVPELYRPFGNNAKEIENQICDFDSPPLLEYRLDAPDFW